MQRTTTMWTASLTVLFEKIQIDEMKEVKKRDFLKKFD
jgi:hypothetical protein